MAGIPKNQILGRNSQEQATFEDNALARRVLLVDKSGATIDASNGLPVYIVDPGASGNTVRSKFDEITAVAIGATEVILTHTVLAGTEAILVKIEASGSNIATYDLYVNGQIYARKRTYFSGDFTATFDFGTTIATAPKLLEGDKIEVRVTNFRPFLGDFEARLQYIESPT